MEKALSRCPDCGTKFQCDVVAPGEGASCWCMQLPPLPLNAGMKENGKNMPGVCFCPACLQRRIEEASQAKTGAEGKDQQ